MNVFIEALVKFKIAVKHKKAGGNRLAESLIFTKETADNETGRIFKMMHQYMRDKGVIFDPLNQFERDE